jgi:hypothetical protein
MTARPKRISAALTTKSRLAGHVLILAAALLAVFATSLPAKANETYPPMDCGYGTEGVGGTFLDPGTAYTQTDDCYITYFTGTYYEFGVPHAYGIGYAAASLQRADIYGQSAASTHRLCTAGYAICGQFAGTSSS